MHTQKFSHMPGGKVLEIIIAILTIVIYYLFGTSICQCT